MSGYAAHDFAWAVRRLLYILLIGTLLLYVFIQARPLIEGPRLTLRAERESAESRIVALSGTARNITALILNDRPIFTDEQGAWRERLVLENGYTILTLRAEDRFGRTAQLERALVYAPAYERTAADGSGEQN